MIAGQPGAGKSLLALWASCKWAEHHNLRGIYFSADSAELGQASRALAMTMMNLTVREAEKMLESGDEWASASLEKLNGLSWSFEDDLSYDNINAEIEAHAEMWGGYPDFVVVDNLTDVEGQSEDEGATKKRAMKALVALARATDAGIIVLDHTSEEAKEDPCPPRKAILYKASAKPALILTTADWGARRPVAVVKDRYTGKADKSGSTAQWLRLDTDTLHFSEA